MPFWFGKPLWAGMDSKYGSDYQFDLSDFARYANSPSTGFLLIIHGKRGVADSDTADRFLLVDGWDLPKKTMRPFKGKLALAIGGDGSKPVPPPILKGEAIVVLTSENRGSAIYWDGKRYRWYPVRSERV